MCSKLSFPNCVDPFSPKSDDET
uniref:Uncharacterized protein n=1 Tax=Physcomitrium patens TaxID=3218 RepID=A0A2K1K086_PHYPA|nr:hypothetical protein PHYPA_014311 [Physcomitrium patens]